MTKRAQLLRIATAITALGALGAGVHLQSTQRAQAQGASIEGVFIRDMDAFASDEAIRAAAIVESTAALEGEPRDRWRALLEEITRPTLRVIFRHDGEGLVVEDGGAMESRGSSDGGNPLDASSGALVQRIETTDLLGETLSPPMVHTITYLLDEEGQTLTVESRVEGAGLPAAIEFSGTYERN